MLTEGHLYVIRILEIPVDLAASVAKGAVSAVGHADTAEVFSTVLGVEVPCNRITVSLKGGEVIIVGQYSGPRLPEGASKLPDGATIKWFLVTVD